MIKRSRRSGSFAVELLLTTPVLLGLIFAVVQIAMMTAANEHLAAASREGCRVAALGGGPSEIIRAVQNHLGQGNLGTAQIQAVLTQQQDGTPVLTALTDDNGQPINDPFQSNGQSSNEPTQPVPSGEPVLVRVQTPASNAVPDLLAILGVSVQNNNLVGQTIMRKE
jgi:Flp pilus assembly protein TadG